MTEWLHFHFSLSCTGEGNGNPLQCSCLENPRDRGAWWAALYGVAQSWTWLKRLSSSRIPDPKAIFILHHLCEMRGPGPTTLPTIRIQQVRTRALSQPAWFWAPPAVTRWLTVVRSPSLLVTASWSAPQWTSLRSRSASRPFLNHQHRAHSVVHTMTVGCSSQFTL